MVVAYAGELCDERGKRDEPKWVAQSMDDFANARLGGELWVVRVPADFDESCLDGQVVVPDKPTLTLQTEGGAYVCRRDDHVSGAAGQLTCFVRSGKAANGIKLGPNLVQSFDVVKVPHEEASEAEQEDYDEEQDRLDKIKEVVSRLCSGPRPQVPMTARFSHLGDPNAFANRSLPSPTSKKRRRSEKSAHKSPKKAKKKKKSKT